jgi:hypothetical protein
VGNNGTCKNLGYVYDAAGTSQTQHDVLMEDLTADVQRLRYLRVPRSIKLAVLDESVVPGVLYRTQFSNLPNSKLRQLDTLIDPLRRSLLHVRRSFPTRLVHGAAETCGIDCPSIETETQHRKLSMLTRWQRHPDHAINAAANGLIHRAFRKGDVYAPPGHAAVLRADDYPVYTTITQAARGQPLWMDSIVEYGLEAGLDLALGGRTLPGTDANRGLWQYVTEGCARALSQPERDTLVFRQINTVWDCMDSVCRPIDEIATHFPWLSPLLSRVAWSPATRQRLYPGQFWFFPSCPAVWPSSFVEILGACTTDPDQPIYVRHWSPQPTWRFMRDRLEDARLTITPGYRSHGSGSAHTMRYFELFGRADTVRGLRQCLITADQTSAEVGLYRDIWAVVIRAAPAPWAVAPLSSSALSLDGWRITDAAQLPLCDVFTDGTYSEHRSGAHEILRSKPDAITAGGSVVFLPQGADWRLRPVHALRLVGGEATNPRGANAMEMLASTYAAHVIRVRDLSARVRDHFSDCEGSLKPLNDAAGAYYRRASDQTLMLQAFHQAPQTRILHQRSHPERRTARREDWTRQEFGIWLADAVADPSQSAAAISEQGGARLFIHEVSAASALRDVYSGTTRPILHWQRQPAPAAADALLPLPSPAPLVQLRPTSLVASRRQRNYLANRDSYHAPEPHKQQCWRERDMTITGRLWGVSRSACSAPRRAVISKVVYDWVWDQRNQAKGTGVPLPESALMCPLCSSTNDDQAHLLCDCTETAIFKARQRLREQHERTADSLQERFPQAHAVALALFNHMWATTTTPSAEGEQPFRPHLYFTGVWPTRHVEHLQGLLDACAPDTANLAALKPAIRSMLRAATSFTTEAYRMRAIAKRNAAMTSRARLYACARPTSSQQPRIPEALNLPNADRIRRGHDRAAGAARGQAAARAAAELAGPAGAPSRPPARRTGTKPKTKSALRKVLRQPSFAAGAGQLAGDADLPILLRTVRFADTALTSVFCVDYTDDDDVSYYDACDAFLRGRRRHRGGGATAAARDDCPDPEAGPRPPPRVDPARPPCAPKALERLRLAHSRTALIGRLGAGHCPRPPVG